ncbi:MAG: Gfo/Idh/MocA family oxidoreductase, partial [Ktedonobacteraceae bacterium]|nr:Gfo/Idh/MocA family oxidoreductase [Ktedonobacteraceae bacterium]
QELGCAFYNDHHQMLQQERPDVVVVMTPHPLHARLAIDSLRAGSHVLVEKPIAVQVGEADEMIRVATEQQRLLGVVFQQRFRPEVKTARRLLQEGRLGALQRVEFTVAWTRPASYFQQATWRGTWKGEGGGVLMNQAAHNLDLLCYLIGAPERLVAWTPRLLHNIEAEDTAHALLEFPGGVLGYLHISTAEVDKVERLKIVGTAGSMEISRQQALTVRLLDTDIRDFVKTSPNPYSSPGEQQVEVELEAGQGKHVEVYQAFHRAILQGEPFISPGEAGLAALELANGLIYSHYTHSQVELPLNRQKYADLLTGLRDGKGQQ